MNLSSAPWLRARRCPAQGCLDLWARPSTVMLVLGFVVPLCPEDMLPRDELSFLGFIKTSLF